jgi:hypothetical protein
VDLLGLGQRGGPLLVRRGALVLGFGYRRDQHVAGALLRNGVARHRLDDDLRDASLGRRRDGHLVAEVGAELFDQQLAADVLPERGVVDPLLAKRVAEPALRRRLAPVHELQDGEPTLRLDRAHDVARLRVRQRVEVLRIRRVVRLEPAKLPADLGGEVVADLRRDDGEVLAALEAGDDVLGGGARRLHLLVGRLRVRLGVVGERRDEDHARRDPLGQGPPLRDAGVDLLVGDADPELLGPRREDGGVDERVRGGSRQAGQLEAQRVHLLLDGLVARTAELGLELRELGDGLGADDALADVEVRSVVGRAGDGSNRTEMRLPVAVPRRGAENADREGNGQREPGDGQLLGPQLVLPARTMLAVEDGARSEGHRLTGLTRRLGVRRSWPRALGGAPC